MTALERAVQRRRLAQACIALALAAVPLASCKEVETEAPAGYQPSKLTPVSGRDDVELVTFTPEGARRVGLKMAPVGDLHGRTVIPYAALIYDAEGKTYVYTSPKPLSFLRAEVKVDRIDGNRVLLSKGPPAGTTVVTVGAAQVYGTELEVAGSH